MKMNKSFFLIITILSLFSFASNSTKGQTKTKIKSYTIEPFIATFITSDYSMARSVEVNLSNSELKIIFKGELVGEKDSILFSKYLQPSDTLQEISHINLDSLQENYSNNCIDDGSQITVILKKDEKEKSVHLSNFYQNDIGKIIYLANSLVPDKYKIWYDRKTLIAEYKRCRSN
jgi:hypothetical protein